MPLNIDYVEELLNEKKAPTQVRTPTAQELLFPEADPPPKRRSRMNLDYVESLLADDHPKVQESKVKQPQTAPDSPQASTLFTRADFEEQERRDNAHLPLLGPHRRPDGTLTGQGFLGTLKGKTGMENAEISIGVQLEANDGKETDIPTLIPGLTEQEKNYLIDTPESDISTVNPELFSTIMQKAVDHANERVRQGKSPFAEQGEQEAPQGTQLLTPSAEPIASDQQPATGRDVLTPQVPSYLGFGGMVPVGSVPFGYTPPPQPEFLDDEEFGALKQYAAERDYVPLDLEEFKALTKAWYAGDEKEAFEKIGKDTDRRAELYGKYFISLGGKVGSKKFLKKLNEDIAAEGEFTGLGLETAGKLGSLALEMKLIYPLLFGAAGEAGKLATKIKPVAKALEKMKDVSGLAKLAKTNPTAHRYLTQAMKAFGKGDVAGQTLAAVESIGKDKEFQDWIIDMNKRGLLIGSLATVFSLADTQAKFATIKQLRLMGEQAVSRQTRTDIAKSRGRKIPSAREREAERLSKFLDKAIYNIEQEMFGKQSFYKGKKVNAKKLFDSLMRQGVNENTIRLSQQFPARPKAEADELAKTTGTVIEFLAKKPTSFALNTGRTKIDPKTGEILTEYKYTPIPESATTAKKLPGQGPQAAQIEAGGQVVHTMPDGSTMPGPEHHGAIPGSTRPVEIPTTQPSGPAATGLAKSIEAKTFQERVEAFPEGPSKDAGYKALDKAMEQNPDMTDEEAFQVVLESAQKREDRLTGIKERGKAPAPTEEGTEVFSEAKIKGFVGKFQAVQNAADNLLAGANKKRQVKAINESMEFLTEQLKGISEVVEQNPEALSDVKAIKDIFPKYTEAIDAFVKKPTQEGLDAVNDLAAQIKESQQQFGVKLGEQGPAGEVEGKQPWEMTKKEYANSGNELSEAYHFNGIVIALREGKPVPAEVLKDYPELAPTPTEAPDEKKKGRKVKAKKQELVSAADLQDERLEGDFAGVTDDQLKERMDGLKAKLSGGKLNMADNNEAAADLRHMMFEEKRRARLSVEAKAKKPKGEAGRDLRGSIGAAKDPSLDRALQRASKSQQVTYVMQQKGKWINFKRAPKYGNYFKVGPEGSEEVRGQTFFKADKDAIVAAQYIAKSTQKPVYIKSTAKGYELVDEQPNSSHVKVNPAGPGLTKEERATLSDMQIAEAEIAQEEGQKVGFKAGRAEALHEARRTLDDFRMAEKLTDKHRKDAADIVTRYVPKELQHKYTKRILEAKTNKRIERLTEAIDEYLDRAEHRQVKNEFKGFIKSLGKKYNAGEVKLGKLRNDVREQVLSILNDYDLSKLSDKKRKQLEKRDNYIRQVAGSVANAFESLEESGIDILQMPNARTEELKRLSKTDIGSLDADQIRYIHASLDHLVKTAEAKGSSKERTRAERVGKLVNKAPQEISSTTKEEGVIGEKQGMGNLVKRIGGIAQANIKTLVQMFTAKDNSATKELLVDRLYEAHQKKSEKAKEFVLESRKEFAAKDITKKTTKILDKNTKFTLGGKTFRLDLDNLLSVYMHIKAEGNLRRLLTSEGLEFTIYERNSILFNVIKRKMTVYTGKVKLQELRNIISLAEQKHPELKKMAEATFDINNKYQKPAINEISLAVQNYELARKDKYWPIHRVMSQKIGGAGTDISTAIENQGRYLPRTGGTQRIRIVPWRQEFIASLQSNATFYGVTEAMQDVRALVGSKKWQDAMKEKGRGNELNTLVKMLRRIQNQTTDKSFIDRAGAKLLNQFGKSVLSLRLSGYGVQTASIPAAWEVIEPKYFHKLRPLAKLPTVPIKGVREMMELSPRLWMRWTARQFDFVTGGIAAQHSFDTLIHESSPMTDKGLNQYTWGDQKAIYQIYTAAKEKVAAETDLKRGTDEFKKAAIAITEKALDTQPQWDMLFRSEFTSHPSVWFKPLAMFMSARNAQYNVLLRAVSDYKQGRISGGEAGKRISGVLYANVLVSIVKTATKLGIKYGWLLALFLLGDEEEKEKVVKASKQVAVKAAKQIPIDAMMNVMSLPVFGAVVQNLTHETIKTLRQSYTSRQLKDVRTGYIFADIGLDLTGIAIDTAKLGKHLIEKDTPKGVFQSGPDEGKPKWIRDVKEIADGTAGLIAVANGLPYSAPKGEVYYQIKSAERSVEKALSKKELQQKIEDNTYKKTTIGRDKKTGKKIKRRKGEAHKGQEDNVLGWRKELDSSTREHLK